MYGLGVTLPVFSIFDASDEVDGLIECSDNCTVSVEYDQAESGITFSNSLSNITRWSSSHNDHCIVLRLCSQAGRV